MKPEDVFQSIEESIEDIGFKMIHIKNSRDFPVYSYTVGLAREGLPDVFISGIPDLNLTGSLIYTAVNAFREQQRQGPVIENGLVTVDTGSRIQLMVAESGTLYEERVLLAKDFYQAPTPFVQIVWPDDEGHLPTSSYYNAEKFPQEIFFKRTLH